MGIEQVFSIRGATTVDNNIASEIADKSIELISQMIEENGLNDNGVSIVHYIISTTQDITAMYPAKAIRESGLTNAPVFSCVEPNIENSLPLCIRILMEVSTTKIRLLKPRHIYLHNATKLRKDLMGD